METSTLYRSSSTSQLNSSSYIKGDDPTDGINLSANAKLLRAPSHLSDHCSNSMMNKAPIKAASCDDIAKVSEASTKRANFPYAFLRSKLSVLPEENGGSVLNHKRILENTLMRNGMALAAATSMATPTQQLPATSSTAALLLTAPQPFRQYNNRLSADTSFVHRYPDLPVTTAAGNALINCSRSNSIRESFADENSSTISNSPRTSNIDWESTFQRLNSCLSSNESGYDSDGRHTEEHHMSPGSAMIKESDVGRPHIRRLSSCSSVNSVVKSYVDNSAVRRRFRPIKLDRQHREDHIGIILAPQYSHGEDLNIECRYLIAEIDPTGLAHQDGRLRIGDEIVNVNGNRLRGLASYGTVQQMVTTFVNDSVELVIAHDELTTFSSDACFRLAGSVVERLASASNESELPSDSGTLSTMPLSIVKRLSFSSCSALNKDCDIDLPVFDHDRKSQSNCAAPVATQTTSASTAEPRGIVEQRIQELQAQGVGARRSQTSKGIELTPLQSSTEYVPVYANRATITNTISDDEKWQLLSKKRCSELSSEPRQRNSIAFAESILCVDSTQDTDKATRSTHSTVYNLLSKFESDKSVAPQYRSARMKTVNALANDESTDVSALNNESVVGDEMPAPLADAATTGLADTKALESPASANASIVNDPIAESIAVQELDGMAVLMNCDMDDGQIATTSTFVEGKHQQSLYIIILNIFLFSRVLCRSFQIYLLQDHI